MDFIVGSSGEEDEDDDMNQQNIVQAQMSKPENDIIDLTDDSEKLVAEAEPELQPALAHSQGNLFHSDSSVSIFFIRLNRICKRY